MIPTHLKHNFVFDLALTFSSAEEKRCHRCANCGLWSESENVNTFQGVCPKRDRRNANRRKGGDRRANIGNVQKPQTLSDELDNTGSRGTVSSLPSS
jgi:hypothetical protein